MSGIQDDLREAFEANGYDVIEASADRRRIRLVLLAEGANPEELKSITTEVVDETDIFGFNVATETIGGRDEIGTAVSFRRRS